jgi:hypothetical protein
VLGSYNSWLHADCATDGQQCLQLPLLNRDRSLVGSTWQHALKYWLVALLYDEYSEPALISGAHAYGVQR